MSSRFADPWADSLVSRDDLATSAWSPSLSPEGRQVAVVSDRDGSPRLWVIDRRSRDWRRIETGPAPVQLARWSVDGDWIAVQVAPGGSPRTEVWVVRPDGSALHGVAGGGGGAAMLGPWTHQTAVLATSHTSPPPEDGASELIDVSRGADFPRFRVARHGHPVVLDVDRGRNWALVRRGARGERTVWAIDLRTREEQCVVPAAGPGSTDLGRLSPDSRIAYVRSDIGREMPALFAVHLVDGGKPQRAMLVAEHADAELEHLELTANGDAAVLLWNHAGRSLCERIQLATGARTAIALPEPVAHDISFSHDGRWLAITLEGPAAPRAAWLFDLERDHREMITPQSPGWTAPSASPTLERLRAHDGLEITGWLYRPRERRTGAAVIYLHGGPESQERPGYSELFQRLVARGLAVFAPNVRGSSGFGRTFVRADDTHRRFDAIEDVATCARFLLSSGVASPGRIACAGRSYGGYLTLAALVFHPELFAAGVDICGMADFHTFYADTEPWIAAAAFPKYGHPERDRELLRALSPIHRFDALRAPLLVVHGENDSNVPVGEARQVVSAARARGIAVEYLMFPAEGHEIVDRAHRALFLQTTVGWLNERLARF